MIVQRVKYININVKVIFNVKVMDCSDSKLKVRDSRSLGKGSTLNIIMSSVKIEKEEGRKVGK